MSGHSKWSTIKHKKAATDAKKGKVFSLLSKQIRVAVKEGKSGDPDQNPALRLALEKARQANMPKENVQRAIEKGLGRSASGVVYEEVVYEGYGGGGVGFRIMVVTDNRNRTGSEIRSLLEKAGGSLGGPGSTTFLFKILPDGSAQTQIPVQITDESVRSRVEELIEALEVIDEVESVYTNLQ